MDITTVIINYQTPDLLETAVTSFTHHYPHIPLLIIDNGSKDESPSIISNLCKTKSAVSAHFLDENIYHGPAMDFAARNLVSSDFIFFLDSDTETKQPGFLEKMIKQLEEPDAYAVGELLTVNARGFKSTKGFQILMTPYMLIKRNNYLNLPPFEHHGQPTLANYKAAQHQGLVLKEFPVSNYIFHHWRGTASRFGYGLGWKAKLDFVLNKLGL